MICGGVNHTAAKHRLIGLLARGLPCSGAIPLRSKLALLFEEASLFFKQVAYVLQKALLVVEDVVLVLNEGDTEDVEDTLG